MARIALFAGNGVPAVSGFQVKSSLVSLEQAPRIYDVVDSENSVESHPNEVGILCFSKDRPFQLEQFLISTEEFLLSAENTLRILVLFSPGTQQMILSLSILTLQNLLNILL